MTEPDDGILNRWSRRKLDDGKTASPDPDPIAESEPPSAVAERDEEQAPLDLPDIDSLDKESDYTVFMQDGVPEEIKKLALRALWRSDPVLANLDGLNDYDEDFGSIMRVGAEFMRKLALDEKENGRGEGFRPLEEPPESEPDQPDDDSPEDAADEMVEDDDGREKSGDIS